MIEIIVVLGVIGMIAAFGVIAGLDTYSRYNFRSDVSSAVALLQKARSESINNIGGTPHGIYFDNSSPDLILFSGASYAGTYELKIEKAKAASYSAPVCTSGNQVIFAQLSGRTTACSIDINDGVRSVTININDEGGIDW